MCWCPDPTHKDGKLPMSYSTSPEHSLSTVMSSLCSLKPSRESFKLMEMQSYSTTQQRNRNENHNFVANLYEVWQEPYLKELWFPGCFSKLPKPWESFSFLVSEVSPTVNPIPRPKKDLSLWDASSPPRALPAKLQEGLVCPACQKVMWDLVQPLCLWQAAVTAANVTETPIRQMKLRWKLRRVANAVLSILEVCPRYCKPQIT